MIEIDRILEGLAQTLEQAVLPAVGGGYARGQLFAALEVLAGLQGQVQWGGLLLDHEAQALASLATQAADAVTGEFGARAAAVAAMASEPLEDRLREGRALVCALIEDGHADDDGALASSIRGYLANDSIFKAMGLRPSRLAEISQG